MGVTWAPASLVQYLASYARIKYEAVSLSSKLVLNIQVQMD